MSAADAARRAADAGPDPLVIDETAPLAADAPEAFIDWLEEMTAGAAPVSARIEGIVAARGVLRTLSLLRDVLADGASVVIAEADFVSVYEALCDVVAIHPEYRFEALDFAPAEGGRAGRGFALIAFRRGRAKRQDPADIPANKDRAHRDDGFAAAEPAMPLGTAEARVLNALARWHAPSPQEADRRMRAMAEQFPDGAAAQSYWHQATGQSFTAFFTWGHDHDFGFGHVRAGAMATRHVEIVSESLAFGLLPVDLDGAELLNVGCWTGGDVLALAGLGARVTAIEEHPVSARAAERLCALVGAEATVLRQSLYDDRRDWARRFDVVYCSGVIYHVTDPLLLLRLCFAYLRPGGRLVIETKAESGVGSACAYAGTMEKGWNWYSPTRAALGRWMVDAGFDPDDVRLHWRPIGRLLGGAVKSAAAALPDPAGFSRPASWLVDEA